MSSKLSEGQELTLKLTKLLKSNPLRLSGSFGSELGDGGGIRQDAVVERQIGDSSLYLTAFKLLVLFESFLRNNMQKQNLQQEKRNEAKQLVQFMKKLADKGIFETSLPKGDCYLCHTREATYCQKCTKRLLALREKVILKKYGNSLLESKIQNLGAGMEKNGLTKRIAYLKSKVAKEKKEQQIQKLRNRVVRLREKLEWGREAIKKQREINKCKLDQIKEVFKIVNAKKEGLGQYPNEIKMLTKKKHETTESLAICRRELIEKLLLILAIYPKSETQTFIVNIPLPNDGNYSNVDATKVAAALGHVLHLVQLMATYLSVSLPYEMTFRSSNSVLWKKESVVSKEFTLSPYSRDFPTALHMLNANIIALCYSQGLEFLGESPEKHTLLNLKKLIQSPNLGRELPELILLPPHFNAPKHIKKMPSVALIRTLTDEEDEDGFVVMKDPEPPRPDEIESLMHWEQAFKDHKH